MKQYKNFKKMQGNGKREKISIVLTLGVNYGHSQDEKRDNLGGGANGGKRAEGFPREMRRR